MENKFQFTAGSFPEFLDQYVNGVENTMNRIVRMLDDGNNPNGCSFNFYYCHLLMQVRLYYPNVEKKLAAIFEQNLQLWKSALQKAKENGEIRQDLDVEETASMFWQVFSGISVEQSLIGRYGTAFYRTSAWIWLQTKTMSCRQNESRILYRLRPALLRVMSSQTKPARKSITPMRTETRAR